MQIKDYTKAAAGALGALCLTVAVASFVSARDIVSLPGFGQGNGQETAQGVMQGVKNRVRENLPDLTLDQQKVRIAENIDRTIENLQERLANLDEFEMLSDDLKNQLSSLINSHLNNLPTYKSQVQAAADQDALDAVVDAMHEDGKAMQDFMRDNRPTREELRAQWDSLTLDEKKAQITERLNNQIENLNEREAELNDLISKVNGAASDDDLSTLVPGNGLGMGPGMGPGMGHGRGPGMKGPFAQDDYSSVTDTE